MTICNDHPGPEAWQPVPRARFYQVSDRGRVRSVDRTLPDGRSRKGVLLRTRVSNKGYVLVGYTEDNGRVVTRTVHTIELEAFRGPCPRGQEACHLNDVPTDNCLENLRWDEREGNLRDRMRNNPAAPPAEPKPPQVCVRCHRNPVTRGKRCHPCVVEVGRLTAEGLAEGKSVTDLCAELDYPSADGLMRLAERYGGYSVPLPADAITEREQKRRTWRRKIRALLRGDAA